MTALSRRVGIRDFRNTATQLIREVRETGSEIVITVDGEPVAVVRPFTAGDSESEDLQKDLAVLDRLEMLGEELARFWPEGLSAVDAVSEQRR